MDLISFGAGSIICRPTTLADGTAIANPTPVKLAELQETSVDMSVDIKTLYGGSMYPIAVAQGKAKLDLKAKMAKVSSRALGSLYLGQNATAGIKDLVDGQLATIPASSPYTITVAPPASGTWVEDAGVIDAATGDPLDCVASAPTSGEYSVSAGVYTFAAADEGKQVLISYEYSAVSATAEIYQLDNRLMGYTPSFSVILREAYDGYVITAKFYRAVSSQFSLPFKSDDFPVSDFNASCFANAGGQVGWICMQKAG